MPTKTTTKPAAKTAKKAAAKPVAKKSAAKPEPAAKLTSEQKRRLSALLLSESSKLAADFAKIAKRHKLDDIDPSLVAVQFSQWLQYLPHTDETWPTNFVAPTSKYVRGEA